LGHLPWVLTVHRIAPLEVTRTQGIRGPRVVAEYPQVDFRKIFFASRLQAERVGNWLIRSRAQM
jgi:hypothetical protein